VKICDQASGYLHRGLLLEAERLYQSAASTDSNLADAHVGLAEVRERVGDNGAARKEAQQALELAPSADAYLVLGRLDFEENHLAEAKSEAGNALKLSPGSSAAQELMREVGVRDGSTK
jgi:Tfp pilus assembly protein PilF